MSKPRSLLRVLIPIAVVVGGSFPTAAAEPEPWLSVDVHRPARLLQHELVVDVRSALAESPDFRDRQRTPEFERLRGALEFVESALGVDWETGLDRLVQRAHLRAFDPDRPAANVLVVESESRESLVKLLDALVERVPALEPLAVEARSNADESRIVSIGPVRVAIDGARLTVSGDESLVKRMRSETFSPAEPDGVVLSGRLNFDGLQGRIEKAEPLRFPHRDPGAIATVGGWLGRIRCGRELMVQLVENGERLELTATLGSEEKGQRVEGFFAPTHGPKPALLRPRGTIFAASWYRDYARMWSARDELLQPEIVERIEKRDAEVRDELKVLGFSRLPTEVVGMLGTEYHVVVGRGAAPDYDVQRDERLPTAAIAVSLRDEEEFRTTFEPVFKVVGLILAGEQKMLVKQVPHDEATITTTRYRDDRGAREKGNVLRYHFSPSWSIARGHIVVGSTRRSVETVLDELQRRNRSSSSPGEGPPTGSENGFLSFTEAALALQDARSLLVGRAQLEEGISSDRADTELRVARTILETLGSAAIRTEVDETTITVTLTVGNDENTK